MSGAERLTAHVLAIGDELVRGASLDTNSQYIARRLEDAGLEVVAHSLVGDDPGLMHYCIGGAMAEADVVVSSGGLGPTADDRTRDVAAALGAVELVEHGPSRKRLERWAAERQRTLSASNLRQALIPDGAQVLGNPVGTAPGFRIQVGACQWFALPGVPAEMTHMLGAKVLPWLRREHPGLGAVHCRTVILVGLSEAALGDLLLPFMAHDREPRVGVTAGAGLLKVRVVARSADLDAAAAASAATVAELRPILASHLIAELEGDGDEDLGAVVGRALLAAGRTLATAESCTGGLVAELLTSLPGISAAFQGGYVTYSNAAKERDLGVSQPLLARHGAVSVEVAEAMATGARERTGADLAVAITGVAGPGGGTEAKPVGTVCFALAQEGRCRGWRRDFGAMPRRWLRQRSAWEALAAVLRVLSGTRSEGPSAGSSASPGAG